MKKESKNTKRALAASVGCVALCTAMLVGTTYAWFTDTASTSVNAIKSGKLDVELVGADSTEALTGGLTFAKESQHTSEVVLWEPGASYKTQGFRVKNNGNLALKYKLEIDKDGVATGTDKKSLLDAIDFSVIYIDSSASDQEVEVKLSDFVDYLNAAGTTNDVTTDTSKVYYIKGTMKESAGNEYQNLSLEGITLNVLATQDTVEYDSYSNTYDERATYPVTSSSQLATALTSAKDGDVVVLEDNVTIPDEYTENNRLKVTAANVTIDLNGKTLTAPNYTLELRGDNDVIKNGKVEATGSYGIVAKGKNITIDNVTSNMGISVSGYDNGNYIIDGGGISATITNCTITGGDYYAVCAQGGASAHVEGCILSRANGTLFWVEKSGSGLNSSGETVTFGDSKLEYKNIKVLNAQTFYNTDGLEPICLD